MLRHRPVTQVLSAFSTLSEEGALLVPPGVVAGRLEDIRLLDVREPEEFSHDLGHIPGSERVGFGGFGDGAVGAHAFDSCVLICDDGERSAQLSAWLGSRGQPCSAMSGGIRQWVSLGFRSDSTRPTDVVWARNELFRIYLATNRVPSFRAAAVFRALACRFVASYDRPTRRELFALREGLLDANRAPGRTATPSLAGVLARFDRVMGRERVSIARLAATVPGRPVPR